VLEPNSNEFNVDKVKGYEPFFCTLLEIDAYKLLGFVFSFISFIASSISLLVKMPLGFCLNYEVFISS